MTRAGFSLGLLLITAGLLCLAAGAGTAERDAADAAGLVIGESIHEGNLTIFPVSSKSAKLDDRFITLDEGLRSGKVEILEVGAVEGGAGNGRQPIANQAPANLQQLEQLLPDSQANESDAPAQQGVAQQAEQVADPFAGEQAVQQRLLPFGGNDVNRLMVVNRSEKPLYLMPGEVIVGGDQDRTIGRELVIAPTGKPTPIEVFCVEHGRWGGRSEAVYAELFDFSESIARSENLNIVLSPGATGIAGRGLPDPRAITAEANSGKFVGSIGSLNKGARLAVQKGDGQSEVWNQVSMQNAAVGVQPASGAFTENYSSKDVVSRLDRYQGSLQNAVAGTENIVGVIVAVNGKVESMDVFESTPLFKKLWPKLLKSYALDALKADDGRKSHKQLSRGDARYFMNDVAAAQRKKTDTDGELATTEAENDRVLLFTAHAQNNRAAARAAGEGTTVQLPTFGFDASASMPNPQSPATAAGGFGGLGGGIHSSAFSK